MKKIILSILVAFIFISCVEQDPEASEMHIARIKVLENGSISTIKITDREKTIITVGDTLWINLNTHRIDEISDSSMLGVVEYVSILKYK